MRELNRSYAAARWIPPNSDHGLRSTLGPSLGVGHARPGARLGGYSGDHRCGTRPACGHSSGAGRDAFNSAECPPSLSPGPISIAISFGGQAALRGITLIGGTPRPTECRVSNGPASNVRGILWPPPKCSGDLMIASGICVPRRLKRAARSWSRCFPN